MTTISSAPRASAGSGGARNDHQGVGVEQQHATGCRRPGMPGPLDNLDPADVALALAQRMEVSPDDELVVAVRLALQVADARRAAHRALREVALDVHSAHTAAEWRQWAETRVSFAELQRRRGVETGPDGRPRAARRGVA
ncbi:hypothetical protein [Pseudonocardia sp. MH-G8]|uniref:hypothetical protein n=1 Tax=Pseudonocardia sp. MH-G8 TaxID=1854588 RepID=UPI001304796E|nr:hypothetical protein [Pseudonocardia sp. MH-G8]